MFKEIRQAMIRWVKLCWNSQLNSQSVYWSFAALSSFYNSSGPLQSMLPFFHGLYHTTLPPLRKVLFLSVVGGGGGRGEEKHNWGRGRGLNRHKWDGDQVETVIRSIGVSLDWVLREWSTLMNIHYCTVEHLARCETSLLMKMEPNCTQHQMPTVITISISYSLYSPHQNLRMYAYGVKKFKICSLVEDSFFW